jgi:methyltransferase-like protein
LKTEEKQKSKIMYIWEEDLFHPKHFDSVPKEVKEILNDYGLDNTYGDCAEAIKKLNLLGYTADYDLSATIYNLQKLEQSN